MDITLLGARLPLRRVGTSAIIKIEKNIFLFDCGRRVTARLDQIKVSPNQLTHFFFTHIFHFDHTCNYYDLLMSIQPRKLNIYGPPGTEKYTKDILQLHGKCGERRVNPILDELKNRITDVTTGVICSGDNWKVIGADIDANTTWRSTIIYRVEHENKSAIIAWDIHPRHDLHTKSSTFWEFDDSYTSRKELMDLIEGADLLIADAMKGHTTAEGIGIAAEKAKIKKIVLTHYGNEDQTETMERIKSIFPGEVVIGKDLMNIPL